MTKKEKEARAQEARDTLSKWIKQGDTVYTSVVKVAPSGMSRHIKCYIVLDGRIQDITGWVGDLLDYRQSDKTNGLVVGGCGMDMGFHVVYSLASVLYRNEAKCTGEGCQSNEHFNGDRDYTKGKPHRDAGYQLTQRWL